MAISGSAWLARLRSQQSFTLGLPFSRFSSSGHGCNHFFGSRTGCTLSTGSLSLCFKAQMPTDVRVPVLRRTGSNLGGAANYVDGAEAGWSRGIIAHCELRGLSLLADEVCEFAERIINKSGKPLALAVHLWQRRNPAVDGIIKARLKTSLWPRQGLASTKSRSGFTSAILTKNRRCWSGSRKEAQHDFGFQRHHS